MSKRTKKSRVMYMHTLNEKPARFVPGHEVLVAGVAGGPAIPLCTSLRQIRREQTKDKITTAIKSWQTIRYGYVRVEIPA